MQSEETDNGGEVGVPAELGVLAVESGRSLAGVEIHPGSLRLNIGCGKRRYDGWVNIDSQKSDLDCDVRSIPLPDGCASEAMAIHVFEHIWRSEALATLREWHRLLAPGGLLVLELPDFLKCCKNVVAGMTDQYGRQGIYGDLTVEHEHHLHHWGYVPAEVIGLLREAGFIKSKEAPPQFHGKRSNRDMRIEAIKPHEPKN